MKKFVVISHTHWDREWYMPFEQFRLRLIDLIDNLLDILDKDDTYIFHLDAQTIVLEDYLEVKPAKRGLLEKYIKNGNILVGPWYLQNDFYYASGESTIRNLIMGREIAEEFGKCSKVGYAPDQFGNVSQLPQILNGFGIDSFIFGRGLQIATKNEKGQIEVEPSPAEFVWRAPDGSECIAICLKHWYNNAQHIPDDLRLANLLLDINEKNFEPFNVTPYVLLMNGVDHLEPQDDVNEILKQLREQGRDVKQYSLDEYVSSVKEYIKENALQPQVYTGALDKGRDDSMLKGCRSSRAYLKVAHVRAEDLLENKIEPLYAYLEQSGLKGACPSEEVKYLWKQLMKNQPHDSICGCSRDEVHAHNEDNFLRFEEAANEILRRGLKILTSHVSREGKKETDWFVTAFNTVNEEREEVITASLYVPCDRAISCFSLQDEQGNEIPYELLSEEKAKLDVFSGLNLPGVIDCTLYRFKFLSGKIAPLSHKEYVIKSNVQPKFATGKFAGAENARYKFAINQNKLSIIDKNIGKEYVNPIYLIDEADKGDSYIFRPSYTETPLKIYPSAVNLTKNGVYEKEITLSFKYNCPVEYDFAKDKRSILTKEMTVEAVLGLGQGDVISLNYSLNNVGKDHKVRMCFDFNVNAETLFTDSAFDWSEQKGTECFADTLDKSLCNASFAYANDGKKAFALYTEGQHEVEKSDCGAMLTLVRSTGYINRAPDFTPTGGSQWVVPGNQCIRVINGRIGFELGEKTPWQCFNAAKKFRNELLVYADSYDKTTYSRGRFAVQSAELEKYYYSRDKFEGKTVSAEAKIKAFGDGIISTSYRSNGFGQVEARFVNLKTEDTVLNVEYDGSFELVRLDGRETFAKYEKTAQISIKPKQIVTLRFI